MQSNELETIIDQDGTIHLPIEYKHLYGREARLVILVIESPAIKNRTIDPMLYCNTVDWPVKAMDYQLQARNEWD